MNIIADVKRSTPGTRIVKGGSKEGVRSYRKDDSERYLERTMWYFL